MEVTIKTQQDLDMYMFEFIRTTEDQELITAKINFLSENLHQNYDEFVFDDVDDSIVSFVEKPIIEEIQVNSLKDFNI